MKSNKAEAKVVKDNHGFVCKIARGYGRAVGYDLFDDLVQEGLIGLIEAYRTWRPDGGANLLTWASYRIMMRMRRFIGIDKRTYKLKRKESHVSFDAPTNADGGCLYDLYGIEATQDHAAAAVERCEIVAKALKTLPPRTEKVLRQRFFEEKTLSEVGESVGLSRERARQIQEEGLAKLAGRIAL